MKMKLNYAAVSDVGIVRKNNEDNVYMPNLPIREPLCNVYENSGEMITDKSFFCVCDGMGGHSAGEVASYVAVSHVAQNHNKVIELINRKNKIKSVFRDFISNTNEVIYDAAQKNSEFTAMGTTMAGIYFMNGYAHFVNIGDSRVYTIRKTKLEQLSVDHADAKNTHALTRFLGMSSTYGQVIPDVAGQGEKIGFGKRFLLCSDGLTDMVNDEMILEILTKEIVPEVAARKLVDEAKKRGGRDNITVLVIDAKPANIMSVFLYKKYVLLALCIVLTASVGCVYYLKHIPQETGSSLSDISKNIENAQNLMEARKIFDDYLAKIDLEIHHYDTYINNTDETDNTVKMANNSLREAVQRLKSNKDKLKAEYDRLLDGDSMEDEALFAAIQDLKNTKAYMDTERELAECKNKRSDVEKAFLGFQKMREEERKNEQNTKQNDKTAESNPSVKRNGATGDSPAKKGNTHPEEEALSKTKDLSGTDSEVESPKPKEQSPNKDTKAYDKFPGADRPSASETGTGK